MIKLPLVRAIKFKHVNILSFLILALLGSAAHSQSTGAPRNTFVLKGKTVTTEWRSTDGFKNPCGKKLRGAVEPDFREFNCDGSGTYSYNYGASKGSFKWGYALHPDKQTIKVQPFIEFSDLYNSNEPSVEIILLATSGADQGSLYGEAMGFLKGRVVTTGAFSE
jgi:phosphate-selective porin